MTNVNYEPNRIVFLSSLWKKFLNQKFTEKDIRGLSKREKDFIRKNGYNVVYFQHTTHKHLDKIVLFIDRDLVTGKKRLYGQTKWQMMLPNGEYNDIEPCSARFVYDRWLVPTLDNIRKRKEVFNYLWYEQRFATLPDFSYPYSLT